jgi:exonuclease III
MIVNVHFSNKPENLQREVKSLQSLIEKYKDYVIIVTGDFNASVTLDTNTMELSMYSRDSKTSKDPNVTIKFNNRIIAVGTNSIPTTCKMRIITTQIQKMLEKACFCADWCFAVFPSGRPGTVQTQVLEFQDVITYERVCSLEWCSDHFAIRSKVNIGDKCLVIGSLNALGESIDGDAFNIFEFVSAKALASLNEESKTSFHKIMSTLDPDQVDKKVFSKALRNVNLMNIHLPSFWSDEEFQNNLFTAELKKKYDAELANLKNLDDTTQDLGGTMITFFNKLYADTTLGPWFKEWYREILNSKKKTFAEVLLGYLQSGEFDVFCVQEVSQSMYNQLINMSQIRQYGYQLIAPKAMHAKTVGVILVRAS